MISAEKPTNENQRLASLKELEILDTELEKSYDEITKLAAQICDSPISLVSLIDENRQWFKSRHGLEAESTPREYAFCAHAILQEKVFEISDSRNDERFRDNPLVTGAPNVVFYAGAPLKTPDNLSLGTLCVIDNKPKKLNDFQKHALEVLGHQISMQFELRRNLNKLAQAKANEGALAIAVSFSHEINNPLMIGMANLSKAKSTIDEKIYEKIEVSFLRIRDVTKQISETLQENGIELEEYTEKNKMLKIKKV